MAHRGMAVVSFGALVLAVPLADPVVATPAATTIVTEPLELPSVSPAPFRADSAEDPIIAPRQGR
jgi:hypothetical protein